MPIQVFTATIASATTTASFYLGTEVYERAYLRHSTMSTAADMHLYGSMDGSTYDRVYHVPYNTATTTLLGFTISSSLTQAMVEIPVPTPYIRVAATGAACTPVDVQIITHRNP